MIPLINKRDNFELIRDAVASILAAETVSQQELAESADLDPNDFAFDVYIERINPWDSIGSTPIVNVWFDRLSSDKQGSNSQDRQRVTSRINCDVYVNIESAEDETGHIPGDEQASMNAQRIARIVRNILMHDDYRLLTMSSGVIWWRWITDIQMLQPTSGNQAIQHIVACRLSLDVEHNEEMVEGELNTLEIVNVKFYEDAPE